MFSVGAPTFDNIRFELTRLLLDNCIAQGDNMDILFTPLDRFCIMTGVVCSLAAQQAERSFAE